MSGPDSDARGNAASREGERRERRPGRSAGAGWFPASSGGLVRNLLLLAALVAVMLGVDAGVEALVARDVLSPYSVLIARYVGINVVMAASLNLVNGVAGQFSIGHAGFMAVGAYTSAMITLTTRAQPGTALGTTIFVGSLVAGGILAACAGWLVGLPSLRLRGDYLAIVTLGFGEIIRVVIVNVESLGGSRGLPGIPAFASIFWVGLFAAITIVVLHRVARSDYGRTLLAIREDEVAASAMGVDTTSKKVGAFTIAAFFAGIAGGLFAHTLAYLNPNSFTFIKSFDYVVMVILGGMGSLSGSVLAAVLLTVLLEFLRPTTLARGFSGLGLERAGDWISTHDFRISLYALLLIGMMLLRPNGLLGSREIWNLRAFRWLRRPARGDGS